MFTNQLKRIKANVCADDTDIESYDMWRRPTVYLLCA